MARDVTELCDSDVAPTVVLPLLVHAAADGDRDPREGAAAEGKR